MSSSQSIITTVLSSGVKLENGHDPQGKFSSTTLPVLLSNTAHCFPSFATNRSPDGDTPATVHISVFCVAVGGVGESRQFHPSDPLATPIPWRSKRGHLASEIFSHPPSLEKRQRPSTSGDRRVPTISSELPATF